MPEPGAFEWGEHSTWPGPAETLPTEAEDGPATVRPLPGSRNTPPAGVW